MARFTFLCLGLKRSVPMRPPLVAVLEAAAMPKRSPPQALRSLGAKAVLMVTCLLTCRLFRFRCSCRCCWRLCISVACVTEMLCDMRPQPSYGSSAQPRRSTLLKPFAPLPSGRRGHAAHVPRLIEQYALAQACSMVCHLFSPSMHQVLFSMYARHPCEFIGRTRRREDAVKDGEWATLVFSEPSQSYGSVYSSQHAALAMLPRYAIGDRGNVLSCIFPWC